MITAPIVLPPPSDFGLEAYPSYYPYQDQAVLHCYENPLGSRVTGVCLPTGCGKSLLAAMLYVLSGKRVVVLTSTKALQGQYHRLFGAAPLEIADIRGQNAYQCRVADGVTVDRGPCHAGWDCPYREGGCYYFDAVGRARDGAFVATNYTYWMTMQQYGKGLGNVDILVCDEADTMLNEITAFLSLSFQGGDIQKHLHAALPPVDSSIEAVRLWAGGLLPRIKSRQESLETQMKIFSQSSEQPPGPFRREVREVNLLKDALTRAADLHGEWVAEWAERNHRLNLWPVWPADYAEEVLFRGIPRVILMSATLSRKQMEILNRGPWDYVDYPSAIPPEDRPVRHVRSVAMRRGMQNLPLWTARIDQLIERRLDRKIILHTTSYERKRAFMLGSRFKGKGILISHDSGDLETAVQRFKAMEAPAVLVSPSLTRGYDFPGVQCETLILGKVPYMDGRTPLAKARKERDPDYLNYEAMMTMQQEAGRGARYVGDRCEILVVDDDWRWFWPRFGYMASQWFRDAVQPGVFDVQNTEPLAKL